MPKNDTSWENRIAGIRNRTARLRSDELQGSSRLRRDKSPRQVLRSTAAFPLPASVWGIFARCLACNVMALSKKWKTI